MRPPPRWLQGTGIGFFSSVCTGKSRPLPGYPGNLVARSHPNSFQLQDETPTEKRFRDYGPDDAPPPADFENEDAAPDAAAGAGEGEGVAADAAEGGEGAAQGTDTFFNPP